MDQLIEGIDGSFTKVDDILTVGRDMAHHGQILTEKVTAANLKLNFDNNISVQFVSAKWVIWDIWSLPMDFNQTKSR